MLYDDIVLIFLPLHKHLAVCLLSIQHWTRHCRFNSNVVTSEVGLRVVRDEITEHWGLCQGGLYSIHVLQWEQGGHGRNLRKVVMVVFLILHMELSLIPRVLEPRER